MDEKIPSIVERLSRQKTVPVILASRIVAIIEDSGAAETEALLALGIVRSVLPTLGISAVSETEGRVFALREFDPNP